MLTEIYVEALLVDEELADCIWAIWDAGVFTDQVAAWTSVRTSLIDANSTIDLSALLSDYFRVI
jgi:hypothetical protein